MAQKESRKVPLWPFPSELPHTVLILILGKVGRVVHMDHLQEGLHPLHTQSTLFRLMYVYIGLLLFTC